MTDPPLPDSQRDSAITDYTCPDCGTKMAAGYLAVSGRASWVEEVGAFDARAFKGDNIVGMMDGVAHLRGWRCEECLLMLLEY